ncbi:MULTISPECIES: sensor histidine kinase [Hyphobacterium]|uniref:Sensor histidine kinase n=1 Tax=Hyphobacterium vulgare TaxID=1736751 RepID=A0ABV7A0Q9_9PROT
MLDQTGLVAQAPGWIQSTASQDLSGTTRTLVTGGLPPEARIFVNGILLDAGAASHGGFRTHPLPPGYLSYGSDRLVVIQPDRPALTPPLVAFAESGTAAARVRLFGPMTDAARLFVAILSLALTSLLLGAFAHTANPRHIVVASLCLAAGVAGAPQAFASVSALSDLEWSAVRWLALVPAIALLTTIKDRVRRFEPIRLAALFCFAFAFGAVLTTALLPSLSPWPALFDSGALAMAMTGLVLVLLGALPGAARLIVDLIRHFRQRGEIISYQQGVIARQAKTLEAEIRKRAVLEERARFARDMHDGLGGSLLSLLAEVRSGKVSFDRVETALEDNLDDMRLMIDSLDHADQSLAAALSTLQTRIRPMFEVSGITLNWSQPPRDRLPTLGAEAVLNLLRILQEAASNIVRHSDADRADFVFEAPAIGAMLTFSVSDNGSQAVCRTVGSDRPAYGLRNMANRVAALNGQFAAGYEAGTGWVIRVSVPV